MDVKILPKKLGEVDMNIIGFYIDIEAGWPLFTAIMNLVKPNDCQVAEVDVARPNANRCTEGAKMTSKSLDGAKNYLKHCETYSDM